jgi:hypothetical protein
MQKAIQTNTMLALRNCKKSRIPSCSWEETAGRLSSALISTDLLGF